MMTLFVTLVFVAALAGLILATGMTSLTAVAGKLVFVTAITLLLISVVVGMARGRLRA